MGLSMELLALRLGGALGSADPCGKKHVTNQTIGCRRGGASHVKNNTIGSPASAQDVGDFSKREYLLTNY